MRLRTKLLDGKCQKARKNNSKTSFLLMQTVEEGKEGFPADIGHCSQTNSPPAHPKVVCCIPSNAFLASPSSLPRSSLFLPPPLKKQNNTSTQSQTNSTSLAPRLVPRELACPLLFLSASLSSSSFFFSLLAVNPFSGWSGDLPVKYGWPVNRLWKRKV